ncbi:MAG: hypothetical protein RLZZ196_1031 [Bacteroidota bacterium]|jgi:hypothetical protein
MLKTLCDLGDALTYLLVRGIQVLILVGAVGIFVAQLIGA